MHNENTKVSLDAKSLEQMIIALRMVMMRLGEREAAAEGKDAALAVKDERNAEILYYTYQTKFLAEQMACIIHTIMGDDDDVFSVRYASSFDLFCYHEHNGDVKSALDAVKDMYSDTVGQSQ